MSMKKSNRTWRRPPVEWDKHEKMRSAIFKRKAVDEEDGKRARARWEQRKREKHDNQAREVQQDKLTAEERQAEIKVLTDKLEELHDMKHNYFISLKRILKGEEAQKLAERQQLEELQAKEAQLQQQQQEQQQTKPSAAAAEMDESLPSSHIPIQQPPQLIPPVNAVGNSSPTSQIGGGHMHSLPYMPMLNVQAGGIPGGARMVMDAQGTYSLMHGAQMPMPAQQYIQSGRPVQHAHPMNMAQHAQLGVPIGYTHGHHPQVLGGPHGGMSYMAQQPRLIALSHPVPGGQQQMQAPGLMAQQQGFRGAGPAGYAAGSRGMPHMRFK